MNESDFTKAAFEPPHRPKLLDALMADPVLVGLARARLAHLAKQHEIGQVFDRDAISRMTHEILTRMLAQVDAAKRDAPQVTVE